MDKFILIIVFITQYIKDKFMDKPKQVIPFTQLVSELCSREKGKEQVNAAQMSEILLDLCNIVQENEFDGDNRVINLLKTHKKTK